MTYAAIYSNFPKQCVVCEKITTYNHTARVDTKEITYICSAECFKVIAKINEENISKMRSKL